MMGRRFYPRRVTAIEEPTVNLTPLIDVVFVILIMFIVVAPLLDLDRVELADASAVRDDHTVSVQEASPITVYVREDNQIVVKGQVLSLNELLNYFKEAKIENPGVRPQIFHDRRAHFGTYQSVKNAAETAGFEQLDIILKPS